MSITNAQKARKRGLKKVFNSLTLQTYQTYIQEAFKVFEWLSMTFLASFLKTEKLVMESYCPLEILRPLINFYRTQVSLVRSMGLVVSH